MLNKKIHISYDKLRKIAFVFLSIPFIVFAIGWLRFPWALCMVTTCLFLLYYAYYGFDKPGKKEVKNEIFITVSYKMFLLVIVISFLWVWLSGIGGLWAQSKDYPWRNAIFRDIVLRDWPVYYDQYGGALVYYIGYWLFPALFGKIALAFGASDFLAFRIGNIALLIWSVIAISILFFLLVTLLKADTLKKQLFVVLFFVFFSGMDILGSIEPLGANLYHLEWWADNYQYSSFTTCLFWVFNQSVIPWICMACLLQEKTIKNYVYLGMMCLFSGPLPFLGMFGYCIVIGILKGIKLLKEKQGKKLLFSAFSLSNLLSGLILFPVISSYLLCNDAITGGGAFRVAEEAVSTVESTAVPSAETWLTIGKYLLFISLEFLAYALLIFRKYKRSIIYYVTIFMLVVIPFFKIGGAADFAMRVSIPSLFILYLLCARFIIEEKSWLQKKGTTNRLLYLILCGALLLGMLTPCVEFYRGIRQVALMGVDNPTEDYIYTFGGDGPYTISEETGASFGNFVTTNPEEQRFFIYYAKPNK